MNKTVRAICSLSLAVLLSACGGGGGGSAPAPAPAPTPTPAPTKAILKVSTANVPTGTLVGGIQISIILPAGVTPAVLSGNDASGSVAASGKAVSGVLAVSSYDAVTRTLTPGTISGTGFAAGEFLTITCLIASGTTVTAASFPTQATIITIFDSNSIGIPGAASPIIVTFQ